VLGSYFSYLNTAFDDALNPEKITKQQASEIVKSAVLRDMMQKQKGV
jgi:hypothetical protein